MAGGALIGQKSTVKTAVNPMEPAMNKGIRTVHEPPPEDLKGTLGRKAGTGCWRKLDSNLPFNKWPWASYLISLSHHLLIHKIKVIKSTSGSRVQKFIKIMDSTCMPQCLASWRYSVNLNPFPGAAIRGSQPKGSGVGEMQLIK